MMFNNLKMKIIDVLRELQNGYKEKVPANVPSLMDEIFSSRQDLLGLGTGTGEICLGRNEIEELIRSDWDGGWGDFVMDLDTAEIEQHGDVVWFFVNCTVGYFYEDTSENYAYFVDVACEVALNEKSAPKQRLSYINWLLGLRFHQRPDGKRGYLMPIELSGMMIKEDEKWKIATLNFSQANPSYPDARFEDTSRDYVAEFEKQKIKFTEHTQNASSHEIIKMLDDFKSEGINFDPQQTKIFENGDFVWVMAIGIQRKTISEDVVLRNALQEITNISKDISPEERLLSIKRSAAYALKEISCGLDFTWPIRLSAIIEKTDDGYEIRQKHLSYPCDWIIEGKL